MAFVSINLFIINIVRLESEIFEIISGRGEGLHFTILQRGWRVELQDSGTRGVVLQDNWAQSWLKKMCSLKNVTVLPLTKNIILREKIQ